MRAIARVLAVAGVTAATAGVLAGTALADPPAGVTPAGNSLVGVGSDTTQLVLDQLATDRDAAVPTGAQLYSWDAVGASTTITEKANCTPSTRPNGSGAGINELLLNNRPSGSSTQYCVDFARSSRARGATDPASISFLPFAIDGVTWSADISTGKTNAPTTLTATQLKAIYSCDASILGTGKTGSVTWNEVGGKSTAAVVPVIPQSSSGTRSFFLSKIGVTTLGACVKGQDNTVEENEGTNAIFTTADSPNIVFPYSIAVFLAQSAHNHGAGNQGTQQLQKVQAVSPVSGTGTAAHINSNFPFQREVYNVVRNTNGNVTAPVLPSYLKAVFGDGTGGGWICTAGAAKADIKDYGFNTDPNCGVAQ